MNSITVSYGFVTFINNFRYLEIFVLYNLRNEYNFDRRLVSDSSSMGALNHFWKDISVNLRSKYLILLDIPINLLLWGCESWSLRVSLLNKLEVFLHRIRSRILGFTMTQMKEDRITNDIICRRFFDMPTIKNQIAKRQLTFIGKVTRNSDEQPRQS